MTIQKRLRAMILAGAMSFATYGVYAENVTISTAYPSPYGAYRTLTTTEQTNLSTGTGGTKIGGTGATTSNAELEVVGDTRVTNLILTGSPGGAGTLQASCSGGNCYAVYAP